MGTTQGLQGRACRQEKLHLQLGGGGGGALARCGDCSARARGPGAGLCPFRVLSRLMTKESMNRRQVLGSVPGQPENGGAVPFTHSAEPHKRPVQGMALYVEETEGKQVTSACRETRGAKRPWRESPEEAQQGG